MRLFVFAMLILHSWICLAQIESVVHFRGQNAEEIKINQSVDITRSVPYQVPSTCYNQIPYQRWECHNETRYRQDCQWIPDSQRCWTESERVCRNVPRTRQECQNGPSREICRNLPGREVCVERPRREVCHTNPQGQRSCTTVGGGQSCHTTSGTRECSTVPGERVCRHVSYTEQECENVPRRQCQHVPGRNACQSVPYAEEVCGYETRYRAEPYACQRTEYKDVTTQKKLSGEIQVHFITNGLVEEFPLMISVKALNTKFEAFESFVKLAKEPKVMVILKKKLVEHQESAEEISVSGEVVIEVVEPRMISPMFPKELKDLSFDEDKSILRMIIDGPVSGVGSLEAVVKSIPKWGKSKQVAELKAKYPSERAKISGNILELNLEGLIKHKLAKKNVVMLKLTAPLSVAGELLNAQRPVLGQDYKLELKK